MPNFKRLKNMFSKNAGDADSPDLESENIDDADVQEANEEAPQDLSQMRNKLSELDARFAEAKKPQAPEMNNVDKQKMLASLVQKHGAQSDEVRGFMENIDKPLEESAVDPIDFIDPSVVGKKAAMLGAKAAFPGVKSALGMMAAGSIKKAAAHAAEKEAAELGAKEVAQTALKDMRPMHLRAQATKEALGQTAASEANNIEKGVQNAAANKERIEALLKNKGAAQQAEESLINASIPNPKPIASQEKIDALENIASQIKNPDERNWAFAQINGLIKSSAVKGGTAR